MVKINFRRILNSKTRSAIKRAAVTTNVTNITPVILKSRKSLAYLDSDDEENGAEKLEKKNQKGVTGKKYCHFSPKDKVKTSISSVKERGSKDSPKVKIIPSLSSVQVERKVKRSKSKQKKTKFSTSRARQGVRATRANSVVYAKKRFLRMLEELPSDPFSFWNVKSKRKTRRSQDAGIRKYNDKKVFLFG